MNFIQSYKHTPCIGSDICSDPMLWLECPQNKNCRDLKCGFKHTGQSNEDFIYKHIEQGYRTTPIVNYHNETRQEHYDRVCKEFILILERIEHLYNRRDCIHYQNYKKIYLDRYILYTKSFLKYLDSYINNKRMYFCYTWMNYKPCKNLDCKFAHSLREVYRPPCIHESNCIIPFCIYKHPKQSDASYIDKSKLYYNIKMKQDY
jgi:hypothetical protein